MPITTDVSYKTRGLVLNGTNSGTLSFNVAAGTNTALLLVVHERGTAIQTLTVTYNSVAMTLIGSQTETSLATDLATKVYYLADPTDGTHDIAVSCTSNTQVEVVAVQFNGVLQASPKDVEDGDSSAAGTVQTLNFTLPSVDGVLIIGGSVHEGNNANTTDIGTTLYNTDQGAWVTSSAYSIQVAKASGDLLKWTNGQSVNYAAYGVAIKPVPGDSITPLQRRIKDRQQHLVIR